MEKLRRRLTYANVIGTLALFFALTGGAMAGVKYVIASDTIPAASDLAGSTYANPQIAAGKVTTNKIATGAITSSKFDASVIAPNADKLDGFDSSAFAAAGSSYTKSESDTRFLGINAKAADSDKLDGIDSAGFVQGHGNTLGGFERLSPGETAISRDVGPFHFDFHCISDGSGRPQASVALSSFQATLTAAVQLNMNGGGAFQRVPDPPGGVGFYLGVDDGWLVEATLHGGSPTLTILGSEYVQGDQCAIQYQAFVS